MEKEEIQPKLEFLQNLYEREIWPDEFFDIEEIYRKMVTGENLDESE